MRKFKLRDILTAFLGKVGVYAPFELISGKLIQICVIRPRVGRLAIAEVQLQQRRESEISAVLNGYLHFVQMSGDVLYRFRPVAFSDPHYSQVDRLRRIIRVKVGYYPAIIAVIQLDFPAAVLYLLHNLSGNNLAVGHADNRVLPGKLAVNETPDILRKLIKRILNHKLVGCKVPDNRIMTVHLCCGRSVERKVFLRAEGYRYRVLLAGSELAGGIEGFAAVPRYFIHCVICAGGNIRRIRELYADFRFSNGYLHLRNNIIGELILRDIRHKYASGGDPRYGINAETVLVVS